MPRTSDRAHILEDIDAAIEIAACSYLLVSDEVGEIEVEEEEEEEEHIQDLLEVQEVIVAHHYLSRDTSAGRHDIDVFEAYIYEYPETAFLAFLELFRMHRTCGIWHICGVRIHGICGICGICGTVMRWCPSLTYLVWNMELAAGTWNLEPRQFSRVLRTGT